MEITFNTVIVGLYIFCYFAFGLRGAANFVDNHLSQFCETPEKRWVRYVLIAIAALLFAYIEFAKIVIKGIIKLLQIITGGAF